jgi:hypothetical protein
MEKSFIAICWELAGSLLEYTGQSPGSGLGELGQQRMHTITAVPEGI